MTGKCSKVGKFFPFNFRDFTNKVKKIISLNCGIKIDSLSCMILRVNITPNIKASLNNAQPNSSEASSEFKGFLEELLKEFSKNNELTDNSSFLLFPLFYIQGIAVQDINKLYALIQENNITQEGKGNIFLQISKFLWEKLKSQNVNAQNLDISDNFEYTLPAKEEQTVLKDIFSAISAKKNTSKLDQSLEKLNELLILTNDSADISIKREIISSEALKLLNEKVIQSDIQNITENLIKLNSKNEQNLRDDSSALQSIINSTISTKDNNYLQQKIADLPVIRLNEIPDAIFRAISTSQKTLIVQLEPPELGRIMIKLSMDSLGIKADMKVDFPHVKEMIAGLIPEIKSNLQSSGIKISDFILDLMRDQRGYQDSYNGQGQRKYKGNQKFFEYIV